MEKIIKYGEIPFSYGESVYLNSKEIDNKLVVYLMLKGFRVIEDIRLANDSTIYLTGCRQTYECKTKDEYKTLVDNNIQSFLSNRGITKPNTIKFSINDLINHKYKLPFVLKNENQNGGREKFLINTEEDYENLIKACKKLLSLVSNSKNDIKYRIDYGKYLNSCFSVQEFIETPSEYNTTVRVLTSSSKDLLYASLKYNKKEACNDNTTLLGHLLSKEYPLSTKSIVSNTLSGGENILLGEDNYKELEKTLLENHNINSNQFSSLIETTKGVHEKYNKELGIICGFDYIYDKNRDKWYLLEYHSRPMVGDYSKRQGIFYETSVDKLAAEGRVRATALSLKLKKNGQI